MEYVRCGEFARIAIAQAAATRRSSYDIIPQRKCLLAGPALQGYLEIGAMDRAEEFFNKSWLPYVDYKTGDFGGDCGGNFLTGAGGFLQGLWAGWAGMRLRENSLDFREHYMRSTSRQLLVLLIVCVY